MSRSLIVDSGPLFAAVDRDDQYHHRSQDELNRVSKDGYDLLLAYPTLLEAYTLVLYRLGSGIAVTWLKEVSNGVSLINPNVEDYRDAADWLSRFRGQKITLFDAVVAVIAARLGLQVWTYDHHFDVMRAAVWR